MLKLYLVWHFYMDLMHLSHIHLYCDECFLNTKAVTVSSDPWGWGGGRLRTLMEIGTRILLLIHSCIYPICQSCGCSIMHTIMQILVKH